MQAADPVFFAKRLADKWRVAPEGGETYEAVQRRMRDWYDHVRGDMVVVAHGGTARALMVALGFETPAKRLRPADRAGRGLCVRRRRAEEV